MSKGPTSSVQSVISLPPGLPAPVPPPNIFDQEEAEPQKEEDEPQNDVWQPACETGDEVEARALPPRLRSYERPHGTQNLPPQGRNRLR